MDLLEEYKELYNKEIEAHDRLNNKMGTSLTLLTIIGTAEIFLWKDAYLLPVISSWWWLYIVLNLLSLGTFALSAGAFYRYYTGYEYKYINPKEIRKYIEKTQIYADSNNIPPDKTNEYIKEMLERQYIDFAISNMESNSRKNRSQYILTKWICITFIFVMFAYYIWVSEVNPYRTIYEKQQVQSSCVEREVQLCEDTKTISQ